MMIWTLGPMGIMLYMAACREWTFEMGVWAVEMQLIKVLSMLVEVRAVLKILLVRRRSTRNGKWYKSFLTKDFQPPMLWRNRIPVSFCSLYVVTLVTLPIFLSIMLILRVSTHSSPPFLPPSEEHMFLFPYLIPFTFSFLFEISFQ